MDNTKIVDLYKNKFRHSLIGKWSTVEESFQMMKDVFIFFEDGKGIWKSSSTMSEYETTFNWREKIDLTIEIQEENEENWMEIKYDFKIIENDISKEVILFQNNSDTFYLAMTKISYSEKIIEL